MEGVKSYHEMQLEVELLRQQLQEATDTIAAIRNGEIDALVVNGNDGHQLYTLQSADHTYRVFIEKMTEGAVTINENGTIIYCNSSFAHIVGEPPSIVVSSSFENFVSNADKEQFDELFREGWLHDVKGEIVLKNNGGLVPVQLSITTLKMQEGVSLSIIITDLTTQKNILKELRVKNEQLEALNLALELSNHDLQQFASVASHDLQEPLRKIQIFSHFLKERYFHELSDVPKQYVEKIIFAANRMKMLIVDILNYSKLSSKDNQYEKINLKIIIDEMLEDLELTIKEKQAEIIVDNMPEVEINRGQMRQVFQNLIGNALKFSKKGLNPRIHIYSKEELYGAPESDNKYFHLHIRDNGIGFDQRYAKTIFNLFEKLHPREDYDGTGIGLAITKKIIDKHHGFISVTSKVDDGTEFVISLPHTQRVPVPI